MSDLAKTLAPTDKSEIDLREVSRVLWSGKWLIAGITAAAVVAAVVASLMLPNIYRAEALLAPNDQEGAGGLSALAAQYGGLASLAGINLNRGQADKTAVGLEVLRSRKFLTQFVDRREVLVPLMASTDWDPRTGQLEIDSGSYDTTSGKWVRQVDEPRKPVPSAQEAFRELSRILSIEQDIETGLVKIAVEHYSPVIAKQWVDWLIEDLNSSIMSQDVAEAERAIDYLNEQINNTPLADLQNVFFKLIEEQLKTIMLARVNQEYLLRTLDPAVAPENKAKPNRILIVLLSAILGLFSSVVIVLLSSGVHRRDNSSG